MLLSGFIVALDQWLVFTKGRNHQPVCRDARVLDQILDHTHGTFRRQLPVAVGREQVGLDVRVTVHADHEVIIIEVEQDAFQLLTKDLQLLLPFT